MSISIKQVHLDEAHLWVELSDARTLGVPLTWFPKLLNATEQERQQFELSPRGIHWEGLNEDIPIEKLFIGQRYKAI